MIHSEGKYLLYGLRVAEGPVSDYMPTDSVEQWCMWIYRHIYSMN